jgi:site-specific DNA-methyltransferase (adenine-specific)
MKYPEINTIIQGHVLEILPTLPEVDMVMTSPPYWGLRNYGTEPQCWGNWEGELGLEPHPDLYIQHLCDIMDAVPLKKTGTLWVNLGDTYSGGKGASSGVYDDERDNNRETLQKKHTCIGMPQSIRPSDNRDIGIPPKSLTAIPARFQVEMINRGWILRNVIIWHKPNCMPASVSDRFTVDFEYLFFFSKSQKYYFQQQFEDAKNWGFRDRTNFRGGTQDPKLKHHGLNNCNYEESGRNMRCVWEICPEPTNWEYCRNCKTIFIGKDRNQIRKYAIIENGEERQKLECPICQSTDGWVSHFATYPIELCITPIKAGCPKGGVVLDPFMGSGTTAIAAYKLGRNWIGVELNQEYIDIAEKRTEEEMRQGKLFP